MIHTKTSGSKDSIVGLLILARPAGKEGCNQIDSVSCLKDEEVHRSYHDVDKVMS